MNLEQQIEQCYMDSHMDDWFVPDSDLEYMAAFEYICWHDDCDEENKCAED